MKDQLTYQKKLYLLGGGFALLLVIIYSLNISDTLGLIGESKALKKELSEAYRVIQRARENEKYDEYFRKRENYPETPQLFEMLLMEEISEYCTSHRITLDRFFEPHTYQYNDLKVTTYRFRVESRYSKAVKLIHYLEQEKSLGYVSSVHTFLERNPKTKKYELRTEIHIQHLSS